VSQRGFSLTNYTTVSGLFIVVYHVALLIGLPFYFYFATPSAALIVASVVLLFVSEIGIGAAYHRFYSHRGFTLRKPAEAVLLFLATLAIQGSALRWSFEHRLHHAFVDTDDDPYSIKKGFWYAHVLWLFDPERPIQERRVPDLLKNKLVIFQHKHFAWLSIGSNILVCGLIGWAVGDFLGAFVLAWWTRLFLSHHLTWFINSLAHCWGERTYSKEHTAVDNFILAFLTVGEGYHNYHHTFASDYRNGVRWYHFDPTKWTIWTLSKLGLADNLRRFNKITIRKRLLVEDKRLLLKTLTEQANTKKRELEQRVYQLADVIQVKLNRLAALADEHRKLRQGHADRGLLRESRARLHDLKRSLKHDWKSWSHLCGVVLDPSPQPA
jgi:stearoyl-CoA desaturase (delta-9 desaturase)